MKRLFTRCLLVTLLITMSITTGWAQKSVLDESFASSGIPKGWSMSKAYWVFKGNGALFSCYLENGADTLISPILSLSGTYKPSVAITYSNEANNGKVNEFKVLYRASVTDEWSVWKTMDEANGQVSVKDVLPDGLANVQIALAVAYKLGAETRITRLAVENKTEAADAPTGLTATDVTTTSATLSWDPCNSPLFQQYNLKVNSSKMTDMSAEADILDRVGWLYIDRFYELEDLTPNREYWAYVQYDCGDGDVSPWAEFSFTTPCASISAPFAESFEEALSDCYAIIKGGTAEVSGEFAHNSTKAFKFVSAKGKDNYLIFPEFSGNVKEQQISFWAAAQESGNTYARTITVGVCAERNASSFTEVATLELPKGHQWEFITVSLAGYAGSGKFIALKAANADKENRLFVDDIQIEKASSCPKPMFVGVSEITPNGAKLAWVKAGSETEWNLVVSTKPLADPEDFEPEAAKGEFAGTISANPYSITGLKANTTYFAYLQAGCGSSEWTKAVEFKTAKPVSYPYSEHFDRMPSDRYTNSVAAVPDGWVMDYRCALASDASSYDTKGTTSYLPYVVTTYNNKITPYVNAALYLRGTSAGTGSTKNISSIAILPAMPKAVNTMMVSFWAYTSAAQTVVVGVADTQTNDLPKGEQLGANIKEVGSVELVKDVWKQYKVLLTNYTGEGRYIAFYLKPATATPYVYIDDIEIDEAPDCNAVSAITAEATSVDKATVTWTDASSSTSWVLKVSSSAIDPESADGDIVAAKTLNTKTYDLTGLSMGKTYYIYVSPTCGDMWQSTTVTTLVGMNVPYYNDFSKEPKTGSGNGPQYWTIGNAAGSTSNSYKPYVYTTAWSAASGSTIPAEVKVPSLYIYGYYANSNKTAYAPYAIMPELLNADVKDLQLKFWGHTNQTTASYTKNLYIGVLSDPTDISTLTNITKVELTTAKVSQQFTVDMSSYTGTGKYIVFYLNEEKTGYFMLDNLEISKKGGPVKVGDVAIIESSISRTGGTVTWTEKGTATKWNVRVFDAEQEDPAAGSPAFSATIDATPSAAITGLSSGTNYYVYVQSVVGTETSAWSDCTFFTLCDQFAVPFTEDWESYATGAGKLSQCYKDTATVKVGSSTAPNASEKTGNVIQLNPSSKDQVAMLVFPEMDKPINTLQLTMKASPFTSTYVGPRSHTDIGVWDGTKFEKVAEYEFNLSDNKAWDECYVDFSTYTGSGTRIALRAAYNTANNSINICFDNVQIEQIPQCKKITSVTISEIDSISAKVNWEKAATENAWDLKVSTIKLVDPSAETADIVDIKKMTEMTKALTGLKGHTTYYVYVRSVDEAKDCEGAWSNALEFTTDCQLMRIPYIEDFESYTNTGAGNLPACSFISGEDKDHSYIATTTSLDNKTKMLYLRQVTKGHKNYFAFPEFAIDSVKRLQLNMDVYSGYTGSTYQYNYKIGVMTDPDDPNTFVEVASDFVTGSKACNRRSYSLSGYNGDETGTKFGKFIAIKPDDSKYGANDAVCYLYIDNVSIDFIETCPAPSDLKADSVGINGVKYIWNTDDKSIKHRIRLFDKADADPENDAFIAEKELNDTVAIFEGLNANTLYYAFVRKECSASDISKWSIEAMCHTNCAEIQALPYVETFEGCTPAETPNCWTSILLNGSDAKATTTSSADYVCEGERAMSVNYYYSYSPSKTGLAAAITPKLDVENLKDALIYFDVKRSTAGVSLRIEAASDNTTQADVIAITTIDDLSDKVWKKVFIKLGDFYTSTQPYKYLRFVPQTKSATSGATVYIDNLVITDDLNTVIPVVDMQATKVADNSITFSFKEQTPGVDAWKVAYGLAGGDIAEATIIDTDVETLTLTGLTANTNYDIYVRSAKTDWVGPLTIKTSQVAAVIPYETGFEDNADNALWNLYNVKTVQGDFYKNYFVFGDAANCGAQGSNALFITNDGNAYAYSQETSTVWATRDINIPYAGTYRISYRVKVPGNVQDDKNDEMYIQLVPAGSTFKGEKIKLLDGTERTKSAATNAGKNCYLIDSKIQDVLEFEKRTATLDIMEPGVYTLAMIWYNAAVGLPNKPAAIDSIIVEEYLCTLPSKFEFVSRKAHEVSIKWFAGQCKNFEYVVSEYANLGDPAAIEAEDKIASGTLTEGPQVSISGLKDCSKYSLYVRTICPEGKTEWIEHSFTTACELEVLPYTDNFSELPQCWTFYSASLASGNAGTGSSDYEKWSYIKLNADGMAVLPELNSPLNKVGVELGVFNVTSDMGSVTLGVMDNEWDTDSFEPIKLFVTQEKTGSTGTYNDWHLEIFNKMLNLYQGTGRVLAIKNTGGVTIGLKYVSLLELADCIQPQDVEITGIQQTSATVNWLAGTETSWEIKVNEEEPFVVTENPYVLSGLEHGTTYTIVIRAICDETHKSEWSLPAKFQTVCGVNSLPMFEDFSSFPDCNNKTAKAAALSCWDNLYSEGKIETVWAGETLKYPSFNLSWSKQWAPNAYSWGGNSQQLFFFGNSISTTDHKYRWFISPQYAIEGKATLSFDLRCIDNQGTAAHPDGRFFVAITTDNGETWKKADATQFELDSVYTTKSVSLDKYEGKAIRFAFYMEDLGGTTTAGMGSGQFTFVDNVRMNCTQTYPFKANACQGHDYEGYGFHIAAIDIPVEGKDSTYYRFAVNTEAGCDSIIALTLTTHTAKVANVEETICQGEVYTFGPYELTDPSPAGQPYYISGSTEAGCDSTIYLTLHVNPSDTVNAAAPITVDKSELPKQIDEYLTIAADEPVGQKILVAKMDACHFKRYDVTVTDDAAGIVNITADVESIDVYDALGRKVQTFTPNAGEYQLDLPTGMYMVRKTMTNGQIENIKLYIR